MDRRDSTLLLCYFGMAILLYLLYDALILHVCNSCSSRKLLNCKLHILIMNYEEQVERQVSPCKY